MVWYFHFRTLTSAAEGRGVVMALPCSADAKVLLGGTLGIISEVLSRLAYGFEARVLLTVGGRLEGGAED